MALQEISPSVGRYRIFVLCTQLKNPLRIHLTVDQPVYRSDCRYVTFFFHFYRRVSYRCPCPNASVPKFTTAPARSHVIKEALYLALRVVGRGVRRCESLPLPDLCTTDVVCESLPSAHHAIHWQLETMVAMEEMRAMVADGD